MNYFIVIGGNKTFIMLQSSTHACKFELDIIFTLRNKLHLFYIVHKIFSFEINWVLWSQKYRPRALRI